MTNWIFSLFSQRLINLLTPRNSISDIKLTANKEIIREVLPVLARPRTSPEVAKAEGMQLLTAFMAKKYFLFGSRLPTVKVLVLPVLTTPYSYWPGVVP
jgi:hypothetical protein